MKDNTTAEEKVGQLELVHTAGSSIKWVPLCHMFWYFLIKLDTVTLRPKQDS